jgi:hypothetical protein
VQRVLEDPLDAARDVAGLARADRVVVDLADRRQLGRGSRHEDLVREVQLAAGDVALDDRVPEVAGDLDRRQAVDAAEDVRRVARRGDHAVLDEEEVLARALADHSALVEEDALLVAGLVGLDLGQHGVEVLPRGLRGRDERVRGDAPPRGDLRRARRWPCPHRRGRSPTPRRRSTTSTGQSSGNSPIGPAPR